MSTEEHGMQAVLDRLTRLEERGVARASHVDDKIGRLEVAIAEMVKTVRDLSDDVKAAKTGMRVLMWISSTLVPAVSAAVGWFAHWLTGK